MAHLSWLSLALVLVPAPSISHSVRTTSSPPALRAAIDTEGRADSSSSLQLTPKMLGHYIALRRDLLTFWGIPAHKALLDSAIAKQRILLIKVPLDFNGGNVRQREVELFDYIDLAHREPQIAALFAKNTIAPAQYERLQYAVFQAMEVHTWIDVATRMGMPLSAEGIVAKNVDLVGAHLQELADVRVDTFEPGGAQAISNHDNEWKSNTR